VPQDDRVSQWLLDLKQGDPEAAHKLWTRYFKTTRGNRAQETSRGVKTHLR
jgi:hypothetical protein